MPIKTDTIAFTIICALIVFAPLARGAVHPWAITIIQIGVLAAAICLVIEKRPGKKIALPHSPMNRPIAALMLLFTASAIFSAHRPFAIEGLFLLLTLVAAYYITVQTVHSRKRQRILVYVIIATATLLAVIGMLKQFGFNPLPWWHYPDVNPRYHSNSVTGVYVNRNHLAGFIEMALPFLLILFVLKPRPWETKVGLVVLTLFLLTTQAFTLSRGGWASALAGILLVAADLVFRKNAVHRKTVLTIGIGCIIIAICVLASLPVVQRITTLTHQDPIDTLDSRICIWTATAHQIEDHPLLGTGPNTFALEHPAYQIPGFNTCLPLFAHNDYLHFTAETGILFIPIFIYGCFCFFRAGIRKLKSHSRQKSSLALGAMAGVFAILVHSFSDFNLNIGANAFLFTVIVALATGCLTHKRPAGPI